MRVAHVVAQADAVETKPAEATPGSACAVDLERIEEATR
jgi:hypothetical protein